METWAHRAATQKMGSPPCANIRPTLVRPPLNRPLDGRHHVRSQHAVPADLVSSTSLLAPFSFRCPCSVPPHISTYPSRGPSRALPDPSSSATPRRGVGASTLVGAGLGKR